MPPMEEFKFPDAQQEIKTEAAPTTEEELEIQIEDDTPEEDRGKKPLPKDLVDELEKDDLEDYSEKVKKRLSQMKKVWHDERREKERAFREREEALKFAQIREQEIKQLKQRLGVGEKAFIEEAIRSVKNDLVSAKDKLKQAYESGDSDRIAEAQELLTDVKLRADKISRLRPSLQNDNQGVQTREQVATPQVDQAPQVDKKAEDWRQQNTWFGADEEMTALALGLHDKLVRSGVDPRSDDYYRQIDKTMRKRFPEAFEGEEEEPSQTTEEVEKPAPRKKPATVVAPVTRSTAPRQVRLTPTQVAIAKKLGLSNEQYARELMKLENNNG